MSTDAPTIRQATPDDAPLITTQRHKMFTDNHFGTEDRLHAMDTTFEPWLRERLADGRYLGLLLEKEGQTLAGAGIFIQDFPPHYLDIQPIRAYLLNFYTDPAARGQGYAKQLLDAALTICRNRNIEVITLHASPYGRPIYERRGFTPSNEMMLRPQP